MATAAAYVPFAGPPEVSVVIPAYNEAPRLARTLDETQDFLGKWYDRYELLVVDDGSTDETVAVAEDCGVRVVSLDRNRGKGAAVRAGMFASSGAVRAFMDADNSIAISEVDRLVNAVVGEEAEIAIAVRKPGEQVGSDSFLRRVGHVAFSGTRGLLVPLRDKSGEKIEDTQCGAKAFSARAATAIFPHMRSNNYSFDVEALRRANLQGLTIVGVPVTITNNERSSLRPVRDGLATVGSLTRIRLRTR